MRGRICSDGRAGRPEPGSPDGLAVIAKEAEDAKAAKGANGRLLRSDAPVASLRLGLVERRVRRGDERVGAGVLLRDPSGDPQ